ncbi:hypothetical protein A9Q99_16800 [Gammaproteobacteria bacterium 45_16_T64]|nr:hypothetical protein A9Q99_16800 [Gammaproteobacteria bacterium 45_16_T64]
MTPVLTAEEIQAFLLSVFPKLPSKVISIAPGQLVMEHVTRPYDIRPGGTISGPTMMTLVDTVMYAVLLGHIGTVAMAVTTNLNINFLRKPEPGVLKAEAKLLKLGKQLAVGEVTITCNDDPTPVAHATCTYSIPPSQSAK